MGDPGARSNRLRDRVCLVTGSTGIAAASARRFAAEGASVFVVSRNEDHAQALAGEIAAARGDAGWATADLTRETEVEAAFLRTGFEMFTAGGGSGYIAEKAETSAGWLFPVGDEVSELGYVDMFSDMFGAIDEGRAPQETFYDRYVVNAIMDAAYRSAKARAWEPVELEWRGGTTPRIASTPERYDGQVVIKREVLPDGRQKLILKDPATGDFSDRVIKAG